MMSLMILRNVSKSLLNTVQKRLFLTNAYKLNDVWSKRFENEEILRKVIPENMYNEIERQFNRVQTVTAIDVDVFVHSIPDNDVSFVDELLDVIHKLRMCAETGSMLQSTHYASIRYLINCENFTTLLDVLHDRLNYGLFLDTYLGNYVMDALWKNKDYMNGARAASLFMFQEDFLHSTIRYFSLLHCLTYLKNKETSKPWPVVEKPPEPKGLVQIRVNFIRNPYFDDHFDLVDSDKIIGKTLLLAAEDVDDQSLKLSCQLLGAALYEKFKKIDEILMQTNENDVIFHEICNLIPDNCEYKTKILEKFKKDERNLNDMLETKVRNLLKEYEKSELAYHFDLHKKWAQIRIDELEKQYKKLLQIKRMNEIQKELDEMQLKELRLWFFENEENIEMEIENKEGLIAIEEERNKVVKSKKQLQMEENENYIPPFVESTHNIDSMLKK